MQLTKRRRIFIWLAGCLLAFGVYASFFGVQTSIALEWLFLTRKSPVVRIVPREMYDHSLTQSTGLRLSHSGYDFEIPWNDVDEAKSKTVGQFRVIAFKSGMAMLVSNLRPGEFVSEILKESGNEAAARQIYGEEAVSSDYNFKRLMMEATPGKINPFGSRRDAVRGALLLLIKCIALPSTAETGIYSVRTRFFSGFQYGDPLKRPRSIIVDLYDDKGGVEFNLVNDNRGPAPAVTQADVNRIVQSAVRATTPSNIHAGS